MNIIKRMFHSNLNIRYTRQIKKGTIHVKKRADTDKWRYACWNLRVCVRQGKPNFGIFLSYILLGVWTYIPKAWLFPHNISEETLFYFSSVLPLIVFLLAMVVFAIIALRNKLKRLSAWRIDIVMSNRYYIVVKRHKPKFVKYLGYLTKMLMAFIIVAFAAVVISLAWSFIMSDT